MLFDPDSSFLVLAFAAGSVVLLAEAVYLLFFSSTSYRTSINRRLQLMKGQPDRQSVLVQLRRDAVGEPRRAAAGLRAVDSAGLRERSSTASDCNPGATSPTSRRAKRRSSTDFQLTQRRA